MVTYKVHKSVNFSLLIALSYTELDDLEHFTSPSVEQSKRKLILSGIDY